MFALDHINIYVCDVARSRAFYEPVFAAFGFNANREFGEVAVGFGDGAYAVFAIVRSVEANEPGHVAFRVESRAKVDAFYSLAISSGGVCNGPPGLRRHYHEHYYAAFVRDPDGHNIECVCHAPG